METLTMAQALRHMAERAEAGSDTPWDDLEYRGKHHNYWHQVVSQNYLFTFCKPYEVRIKQTPKIVNGVECHPHLGELEPLKNYYVPTALSETGYCMIAGSGSACEKAHARNSVYTTEEAALVEAKAQGWV